MAFTVYNRIAVFAPQGFLNGEIFTPNNSLIVGGEVESFNPADGHWLIAATQLQPAPAFTGTSTAFTLSYTLQSNEPSEIDCEILPVDADGNVVSLEFVTNNTLITPQEPLPEATTTPVIVPTTVPIPMQALSGIVTYQNRPTHSEITVELMTVDEAVIQTGTSSDDGSYTLAEIVPGEYRLQFSAPYHLTRIRSVSVLAEAQSTVDLVKLPAGDVDSNQAIDIADAILVGANIGNNGLEEVSHADLNGDSRIDIIDLVLIGGNYGLVGPIVE
jgi:hypothetical protein